MSADTAELAGVDSASELVPPLGRPIVSDGRAPRALRSWARLRSDPAHLTAVRDTRRALLGSRLLVWAAGVGTIVAFGFGPVRKAFNPPGVTRGFGWLGDLLAAPAARWDAAWYLVIAHYGYRPDLGGYTASRAAFFPLYPLALKAVAWFGVAPLLAGVLVSVVALALALYGIHRLTELELRSVPGTASAIGLQPSGRDVARLAVLLTAFAPMAFYLSAVYSESLYLALSVGLLWSARHGRFAAAGVLGALASATRSAGVVLILPALILYVYGPREDRAPDYPLARRLAPRYRLRADLMWLLLMPAGLGLFMGYLALSGGDALMPFHAQSLWGREFAGPFVAVWDGAKAGFEGARQLLSFQSRHSYYPLATGNPLIAAGHNLLLLAFLIAAVPAVVGVVRMLPLAYGAYVIAALALPLSYPVPSQPLMSLPRYLLVLFPLNMWLAAKLAGRRRARAAALVISAMLTAVFVAQFATWHWVA